MTTTFRPAGPEDFAALLELIRTYFSYDDIVFDEPQVRRGLSELLHDVSLGWAFLAEEDGQVIGYALATLGFDLEFGGKRATLTDIYFDPQKRRGGLGSRMLALVEATCRAGGALAIELQVENDNAEARAFYKKHGFAPHTRTPMSKRFK